MEKPMRLLVVVLVVLGASILAVAGCRPEGLTPTPEEEGVSVSAKAAATATVAVQSPSPEKPPTEEPAEAESQAEPQVPVAAPTSGEPGPELVKVISGTVASLVELNWAWDEDLGEDDWYELQIWPYGQEEPSVYGWQKGAKIRLTSAHLLPGRYWWRVVIVRGRGEQRGEALSGYSEAWIFTITRPHTKAQISITPPSVPTRTPSVTPTPTKRRWWYPAASATPTVEQTVKPTWTPTTRPTGIEPTATSTLESTVIQPTATFTPEATVGVPTATWTPVQYPVATNTPVPPTQTTEPGPYPEEPTEAPTEVSTAAPTVTSDVYP